MPGLSEFSAGFGLDELTTKSGRRRAEAQEQQLDIGELQLRIAQELYGGTRELRGSGTSQLENFLNTGSIPAAVNDWNPLNTYGLDAFMAGGEFPAAVRPAARPSVPDVTALSRDTLEQQFARARESTTSRAPTMGGHLADALTDLEGERALGVTGLYNQQNLLQYGANLDAANREDALRRSLYGIGLDLGREDVQDERTLRRNLFSQALGLGFGAPPQTLAGLGGASATFGNVASTALTQSLEQQRRAQDKAGTIGGFGLGGAG